MPETTPELFHTLLDLPLLASALERSVYNFENFESEHFEHQSQKNVTSELRVIFNYLLRNEAGLSINFWETSTTLPLLQEFCRVKKTIVL